jgi:hypothetical protein
MIGPAPPSCGGSHWSPSTRSGYQEIRSLGAKFGMRAPAPCASPVGAVGSRSANQRPAAQIATPAQIALARVRLVIVPVGI